MTIDIKGLGKITASKEVLNLLSAMAYDAETTQANKNHDAIARQYSGIANNIYDALLECGYYNDVMN